MILNRRTFGKVMVGIGLDIAAGISLAGRASAKRPTPKQREIIRKRIEIKDSLDDFLRKKKNRKRLRSGLIDLEEKIVSETSVGRRAHKALLQHVPNMPTFAYRYSLTSPFQDCNGFYNPFTDDIYIIYDSLADWVDTLLMGYSPMLVTRIHESTHNLDHDFSKHRWLLNFFRRERLDTNMGDDKFFIFEDTADNYTEPDRREYKQVGSSSIYMEEDLFARSAKGIMKRFAKAYNRSDNYSKRLPEKSSKKNLKIQARRFGKVLQGIADSSLPASLLTEVHARFVTSFLYEYQTWQIVEAIHNQFNYNYEYFPEHLTDKAVHSIMELYAIMFSIDPRPETWISEGSRIIGSAMHDFDDVTERFHLLDDANEELKQQVEDYSPLDAKRKVYGFAKRSEVREGTEEIRELAVNELGEIIL